MKPENLPLENKGRNHSLTIRKGCLSLLNENNNNGASPNPLCPSGPSFDVRAHLKRERYSNYFDSANMCYKIIENSLDFDEYGVSVPWSALAAWNYEKTDGRESARDEKIFFEVVLSERKIEATTTSDMNRICMKVILQEGWFRLALAGTTKKF